MYLVEHSEKVHYSAARVLLKSKKVSLLELLLAFQVKKRRISLLKECFNLVSTVFGGSISINFWFQ